MTDTGARFNVALRDALVQMSREAANAVRPTIPSKTLQRALRVKMEQGRLSSRLHISHYWALYVHEGRGPKTPQNTVYFIWFVPARLDPRFRGRQTPERAVDVRRLSPQEFAHWMSMNKQAEKKVYGRRRRPDEPQVGPMRIAKKVGPTAARPFFENSSFRQAVQQLATQFLAGAFSAEMQRLATELSDKDTAVGRLG